MLYKTQNIELANISSKDWLEEYLIPNEALKKAAKLLLDSDLPDSFYTNPDFGYMPEEDAFLYSPFSAPMLETAYIRSAKNEDGTFDVAIPIAKIEQTQKKVCIYTFKPVEDAEWGLLSQLVSIEDGNN